MTTPYGVNPNRITDTPTRGQCWVCDELDVIPIADQNRVPAICSEECWEAWARMMNVESSHGGGEDNPAVENGDLESLRAALPPRCTSTANLGEAGAVARCYRGEGHEGDHVDGGFSWTWDAETGTGVISLHVTPEGLTA